jgi:hypothetical protein
VRQSYLQNVVRQGLLSLGYEEQAKTIFLYEVVTLSPTCAEQLGIVASPTTPKRAYQVSGQGPGCKADDLLDLLESEAGRKW